MLSHWMATLSIKRENLSPNVSISLTTDSIQPIVVVCWLSLLSASWILPLVTYHQFLPSGLIWVTIVSHLDSSNGPFMIPHPLLIFFHRAARLILWSNKGFMSVLWIKARWFTVVHTVKTNSPWPSRCFIVGFQTISVVWAPSLLHSISGLLHLLSPPHDTLQAPFMFSSPFMLTGLCTLSSLFLPGSNPPGRAFTILCTCTSEHTSKW